MSWIDQDKQIGEWLDEHGVENYEHCPLIKKTMLYGGSAEKNMAWQDSHYWKMRDSIYETKDVVEIGAGTGQFANIAWRSEFSRSYSIYDLPNIRRLQEWVAGEQDIKWLDNPAPIDGLIVSLFALSEMPYAERDRLLDGFGRDNAMFFAFQEQHEDLLNWDWFLSLAKGLRRDFTIAPCDVDGCWYMYVEAK